LKDFFLFLTGIYFIGVIIAIIRGGAEEEALLVVAGGSVTHPTQDRLGQTQTPLVAGMAVVLMVEAHRMIGDVGPKFKEMGRFSYEK
jgi:hypothetical protein